MPDNRPPSNKPTIKDRLWEAQKQLHQVARGLERPGPHGASYPSDIYDVAGALKIAVKDIADIIDRCSFLLAQASDHGLTTRRVTIDHIIYLDHLHTTAMVLADMLEQEQTALGDIGGTLTPDIPDVPEPPRRTP